MNEILHANIFFIIASVATTIFSLLLILVLWQVFKLVKSVRNIVERVEAGSEQVAADVAHARQLLYSGGVIGRVVGFFVNTSNRRSKNN